MPHEFFDQKGNARPRKKPPQKTSRPPILPNSESHRPVQAITRCDALDLNCQTSGEVVVVRSPTSRLMISAELPRGRHIREMKTAHSSGFQDHEAFHGINRPKQGLCMDTQPSSLRSSL